MPLIKGKKAKSDKGISANISRCAHEGKRPHDSCIAMSMRLAGKPKKKKKVRTKAKTKRRSK